MSTRSTSDKTEIEKAYKQAIQPTPKSSRTREPRYTSTPYISHETRHFPIAPSAPPLEPTANIQETSSATSLLEPNIPLDSVEDKSIELPIERSLEEKSSGRESIDNFPDLPNDDSEIEQTQYLSFDKSVLSVDKSIYSLRLLDTGSELEQTYATTLSDAETVVDAEFSRLLITNIDNMNDNTTTSADNHVNPPATLHYAVEAVPFFDGQNIPLEYFIEGCELAKSMIPSANEIYLTKVIHARLTGEARRSVQNQNFTKISQLTNYLKNLFGSSKSLYELQAELGRIYQRANESVLAYANRAKALSRRILEAYRATNNETLDRTYTTSLEKQLCHSFVRGLTPEIEQRITRNLDVTGTVNEALAIEKELREINSLRGTSNTRNSTDICQICKGAGHTAENCRILPQNLITSHLGNEILICQICKKRGHSADKCRFRDPGTRNPVKFVQSNTLVCQNCSRPGHTAQTCRTFTNQQIICQNCQKPGLSSRECRSNLLNVSCQICNKIGHDAKSCYFNHNRNPAINNDICQWCERRGHSASQCRTRQANNGDNNQPPGRNPPITCQLCHKIGHKARECRGGQIINTNQNRVIQNSANQCRYCKATGHLIENCILRLENNRRNQGNYSGSPTAGARPGTDGPKRPARPVLTQDDRTELL